MMVRAGRGAGLHGGEEGAQHLGVGVAAIEGDLPEQSRGLRGVVRELVTPDDADEGLSTMVPRIALHGAGVIGADRSVVSECLLPGCPVRDRVPA